MFCFLKIKRKGGFNDDIGGQKGQKALTRLKEYNVKSAIYN
jgi:hypothetical protein